MKNGEARPRARVSGFRFIQCQSNGRKDALHIKNLCDSRPAQVETQVDNIRLQQGKSADWRGRQRSVINGKWSVNDFEMKGLRKILRVSWTAKKTNEWVFNKAEVKRELLDIVKARKLAYYGHTMRKQGSWLKKEIMQGTMPGARRRGRPRTAWMDNINTWTWLPVEESIRMTEDRDKWRK